MRHISQVVSIVFVLASLGARASADELEETTVVPVGAPDEAPAEPFDEGLDEAAPEMLPEPEDAASSDAREEAPTVLRTGPVEWAPSIDVRARGEARVNPYVMGADPGGTAYLALTRMRAGLSAKWSAVRAFVQLQDVRSFGVLPGVTDGSSFGVHQGYIELSNERGFLRVGRQEIVLGDQRMMGPLDWLMQARSFDAIRAHGVFGRLSLDVFGAMLRPKSTLSTGQATRGDYLLTFQLTTTLASALSMDLYLLYRHDGPIEASPARNRDVASPGVRLFGRSGALGYTFEGSVQLGDDAGARHLAYGLSGDLRYGLSGSLRTELNAGFALASGNASSGKLREFDNFFPTNHKFYGFADLFGLRNIIEGHVGASMRPSELPLSFAASLFAFSLYDAHARWSDAGGATLGASANGSSRFLGCELDLTASYRPLPGFELSAGYSIFAPAAAARRLDNDDVQHWAFLMLTTSLP